MHYKFHSNILSAIIALMLFSCGNQNGDAKHQNAIDTGKAVTAVTAGSPSGFTVRRLKEDSIILATVQADAIPDSLSLKIDHPFQQIHILIKDVKTDSLNGIIHPEGVMRNIRFNQIILPDSTMDGPFGHDIHYATLQQGDYTLILGKDNMADGKVEGSLTVHIKLK